MFGRRYRRMVKYSMPTEMTGLTGWRRAVVDAHAAVPYYPGKWRVGATLGRRFCSNPPEYATFRRRGVVYKVDPSVLVARAILTDGVWEPAETHFIKRWLRPGMTVADVGANLGYYTLLCSRLVGNQGQVHAFEPTPRTFAILSENLRINGCSNVQTRSCAVGSQAARLQLVETPRYSGSGSNRLGLEAGDTEVITLDSLQWQTLHLLKVDVEGFDLQVLRGAVETLRRCRPVVLVEVNPDGLMKCGDTARELREFLEGLGYRLRQQTWLGQRPFRDPGPGEYPNAIAFPKAQQAEIPA